MEISLSKFIESVKAELKGAQSDEEPFYELTEVELEVAFAMTSEAGGGFKFVVFDLGGKASETATHRVRLKLEPLPVPTPDEPPDSPSPRSDHLRRRMSERRLLRGEAAVFAGRGYGIDEARRPRLEEMEEQLKELERQVKKRPSRPRYRRR
ncbi:trypco2 family protein [Salinicola aestuarinus]|uniref:trypco2 family protein n=1 Tax=Salinicola aestuarinus TaxID=1949082 RepID=UPI000DA13DCA|nr:trypco2 family protein [Salinicola aestuarinus]